MKGGDFMEIEQERGKQYDPQYDPAEIAIAEQQGSVDLAHIATIRKWARPAIQNQRAGEGTNDRFPERAGRIRFDSALELVTTTNSGRPDWSLFNSANEMDAVTDNNR